jgi:hypothetical protein
VEVLPERPVDRLAPLREHGVVAAVRLLEPLGGREVALVQRGGLTGDALDLVCLSRR